MNVPLVEVSAICQAPERNATAKCRFDSMRSGSGRTQSTPGPRPTENSPPDTLRVSGTTASGQRRTVIVSCMVSADVACHQAVLYHAVSGGSRPGPPAAILRPLSRNRFNRASRLVGSPRTADNAITPATALPVKCGCGGTAGCPSGDIEPPLQNAATAVYTSGVP